MFGFNELSTPVKAIIALGLVLLLVLMAGLLLRRIAGGRLKLTGQGSRARQPRLGIVDIFEMDRQRQLVLLRRDNVEHLVMIGGPNDLVIEASIVRSSGRAQVPVVGEAADKSTPQPGLDTRAEPLEEPAPAPRRNPPVTAQEPPTQAPAPKPPVAMVAAAATGLSAGAATLAATAFPANPAAATVDGPAPKPPEPPASAPPKMTPSTPIPAAMATPAASPPPTAMDDKITASFEAELAKMARPPAKPILEPIAPPALAKASANELDDMTRQLQAALKRPFSGVQQAPAPVPHADPAPPALQASAPVAAPIVAAVAPRPEIAQAALVDKLEAKIPERAQAVEIMPVAAPKSSFDFDLERELAAALEPVPVADMVAPLATSTQIIPPPIKPAEPMARAAVGAKAELPVPASEPVAEKPADAPKPEDVLGTSRQDTIKQAASGSPEPDETEAADGAKEPAKETAKETAKPAPKPEPRTTKAGLPAAAEKPEAGSSDPFSVDAIEAEFARLLNRSAPPKT